jgi:hypothetical protein
MSMNRDELVARAEELGLTSSVATRLLASFSSWEIHQAEVRALRYIGLSGDASPTKLLEALLGEQGDKMLPRGLFDLVGGRPGEPVHLTPGLVMGVAVAAQVYVYAHRNSCFIIPESRADCLRQLGGRRASLYRTEPGLFDELRDSIDRLLDFGPFIGPRSPDGGADLLVWHPTGMAEPPFKAIQAKRHAAGKTIGLVEIQPMRGMLIDFQEKPDGISTTSYFTGPLPLSEAAPPFTATAESYRAFTERLNRVFAGRVRWIGPNMV